MPVSPRRWGVGALGRSTLRVLAWQVARMLLQVTWVVAVARQLGAEGYGLLSGVSGLAISLGAFSGLGMGLLMYQETARDKTRFASRWAQARTTTWWSGLALACVFLPIAWVMFGPQPALLLLGIAASELVLQPLIATAAFAYAAHDRMGMSAAMPALLAAARVVAIFAFQLSGGGGLDDYLGYHVASAAIAVAVALGLVRRQLPAPAARSGVALADLRQSLGFSASWASTSALAAMDKALVLRLGGLDMAGHYASAYRLVTLVALPVDALTMAAMPRLFRDANARQIHPRLVPALAACVAAYGSVAGVAVWWLADGLPWLLGESFAPAAGAVRGMAFFLPLYSLRLLALNLLLAMDRKRIKVAVEAGGLVLMGLLAVLLVPSQGLQGAVTMIILVELALASLAWLAIAMAWKRGASP